MTSYKQGREDLMDIAWAGSLKVACRPQVYM